MPMHTVQVDDEVFSFVQKHAAPLVDTFNSALRRQLPITGRGTGAAAPSTDDVGYEPPTGTPQALSQILKVMRRMHVLGESRKEATKQVANSLGVAVQTVIDKYTRQLGINAVWFDRLLIPSNRGDLRKLLQSKFPEHAGAIDEFLTGSALSQQKMPDQEHPLDAAARLFGRHGGTDLAIPARGGAPHKPAPDFDRAEDER
jgi:negative regulator of replication initiation